METKRREDEVTCTLVVTGAEEHLHHHTCHPRPPPLRGDRYFGVFCPPEKVITSVHSVELVVFIAGGARCEQLRTICQLSIEHEDDISSACVEQQSCVIELHDTPCWQKRKGNTIRINYSCARGK